MIYGLSQIIKVPIQKNLEVHKLLYFLQKSRRK